MIALDTDRGHDVRMTWVAPGVPHRAATASWWLAAVIVAAAAGTAVALGLAHPHPEFVPAMLTQTAAWTAAMAVSLPAALGIVIWTARRGYSRLARAMLAGCAAAAAYWLAPAISTALIDAGATGTVAFAISSAYSAVGWTTVLNLLGLTAIVAAAHALGRTVARPAAICLVVVLIGMLVFGLLIPDPPLLDGYPDVPTVLPRAVLQAPTTRAISQTVFLLWIGTLLIAPVALWVAVLRARGLERRILVRIAIGAMIPAMVFGLCGLYGVLSMGSSGSEVVPLAVTFALALSLTFAWLTATVRDAGTASARLTAIGSIVRVLLWGLYLFALIRILVPLAGLLGGSAVAGAGLAVVVMGATYLPWRMLVSWCARKADPRAAMAAATIAADQGGRAGVVAERALRDALGDAGAQLLIRIEDDDRVGWVEADGTAADAPEPGPDAAVLDDGHGRPLAVLITGTRFIDARPLLRVVRPLIERAALEAELRAQSDRIAAERRRADNASAEARRRIERDLHDGVQGRLVSLGLGLSLARDGMADPVSRGLIDETVGQLHDAVAELRELSSGDLSVRLAGTGLAAAVGDLVRRMPVEVQLEIAPIRVARDVEAVAYFVIAEAVTNAVKHAAASSVRVRVADGAEVVVSVADDGSGGADLRTGSGLRGLQERVHAVGGRFLVSEAVPRGTLVEAVLPCAS